MRCLAILAFSALSVSAQDIFQRQKSLEKPVVKKQFTRERLELSSAVPLVETSRGKQIEVGIGGNSESSFVCGQFNPLAGIRALVSEDMAGEATGMLLDIAQGELVANGLTLLCQTSPTLCDVLKHYRFSASAMLKLNYDKCRAIDDALDGATRGLQAQAMRGCLVRKQQEGKSLPEAMRECEREYKDEPLRDVGGDHVRRIELNKQLEKLFGRNPDDERLLDSLTLGPSGAAGSLYTGRVADLYAQSKSEFLKNWSAAVSAAQEGREIGELDGLAPAWAGFRISRQDVGAIASMDERRRGIVLEQLASDLAILDLSKRIQELDQKLSAARTKAELTPGTPLQLSAQLEAQRKELARAMEELLFTRQMNRMAAESFSRFLEVTKGYEIAQASEALKTLGGAGDRRREPGVGKGPYGTISTGPAPALSKPDIFQNQKQVKADCCSAGGSTDWGNK